MIRKLAKQCIANVFKAPKLEFSIQNKQMVTTLFLKKSNRFFNTEKKQSDQNEKKAMNQATSNYGRPDKVQSSLNNLKKQEHTSTHQQLSITPDTKNQNKMTKLPNDSKNQPQITIDPTGSNKTQNSLNNQNNQKSIKKQQGSSDTQNLKTQANNTNSSNSLNSVLNQTLKDLKRIIIQRRKQENQTSHRISISDILQIIVGAVAGVFCLHQYNEAYGQSNKKDDKANEIKANNNLLLQKFGKKPLNVISYYNQNNSTQEQFKRIFEQLSVQNVSIVTGESGIGKTTSLHKLITQKRRSQNICYINLQQQGIVKTIFQLIQAIKSSNKTLQKAKSYTLIIDDINYLTKLPGINNQKEILGLVLQIVYSCRQNKIKLCMISSQRNFYQTLYRQNMLRRLIPNFILIQSKPQNQMKQCIKNMLQYYSENPQLKLTQQQSLKIKNHIIQQGHSLRIAQFLITDMIVEVKHKFQNKEGKINSFSILEECQKNLKKQQRETIKRLKLNREEPSYSLHKKIIFQALLTNNEKEKININRNHYNKEKEFSTNCKRIENVIQQKINQLSKNKIKHIQPEQAYLDSLEKERFLVDCHPRSKFIVNLLKEYQSNL